MNAAFPRLLRLPSVLMFCACVLLSANASAVTTKIKTVATARSPAYEKILMVIFDAPAAQKLMTAALVRELETAASVDVILSRDLMPGVGVPSARTLSQAADSAGVEALLSLRKADSVAAKKAGNAGLAWRYELLLIDHGRKEPVWKGQLLGVATSGETLAELADALAKQVAKELRKKRKLRR